jgi:hypothetical protein
MQKFECFVMFERPDGTTGERKFTVHARTIDDACEMAERHCAEDGRVFFSDVKLV